MALIAEALVVALILSLVLAESRSILDDFLLRDVELQLKVDYVVSDNSWRSMIKTPLSDDFFFCSRDGIGRITAEGETRTLYTHGSECHDLAWHPGLRALLMSSTGGAAYTVDPYADVPTATLIAGTESEGLPLLIHSFTVGIQGYNASAVNFFEGECLRYEFSAKGELVKGMLNCGEIATEQIDGDWDTATFLQPRKMVNVFPSQYLVLQLNGALRLVSRTQVRTLAMTAPAEANCMYSHPFFPGIVFFCADLLVLVLDVLNDRWLQSLSRGSPPIYPIDSISFDSRTGKFEIFSRNSGQRNSMFYTVCCTEVLRPYSLGLVGSSSIEFVRNSSMTFAKEIVHYFGLENGELTSVVDPDMNVTNASFVVFSNQAPSSVTYVTIVSGGNGRVADFVQNIGAASFQQIQHVTPLYGSSSYYYATMPNCVINARIQGDIIPMILGGVCGTPGEAGFVDGLSISTTRFNNPQHLATRRDGLRVYVIVNDRNNDCIREFWSNEPDYHIEAIVGQCLQPGDYDGTGKLSRIQNVSAMLKTDDGIYFSQENGRLAKFSFTTQFVTSISTRLIVSFSQLEVDPYFGEPRLLGMAATGVLLSVDAGTGEIERIFGSFESRLFLEGSGISPEEEGSLSGALSRFAVDPQEGMLVTGERDAQPGYALGKLCCFQQPLWSRDLVFRLIANDEESIVLEKAAVARVNPFMFAYAAQKIRFLDLKTSEETASLAVVDTVTDMAVSTDETLLHVVLALTCVVSVSIENFGIGGYYPIFGEPTASCLLPGQEYAAGSGFSSQKLVSICPVDEPTGFRVIKFDHEVIAEVSSVTLNTSPREYSLQTLPRGYEHASAPSEILDGPVEQAHYRSPRFIVRTGPGRFYVLDKTMDRTRLLMRKEVNRIVSTLRVLPLAMNNLIYRSMRNGWGEDTLLFTSELSVGTHIVYAFNATTGNVYTFAGLRGLDGFTWNSSTQERGPRYVQLNASGESFLIGDGTLISNPTFAQLSFNESVVFADRRGIFLVEVAKIDLQYFGVTHSTAHRGFSTGVRGMTHDFLAPYLYLIAGTTFYRIALDTETGTGSGSPYVMGTGQLHQTEMGLDHRLHMTVGQRYGQTFLFVASLHCIFYLNLSKSIFLFEFTNDTRMCTDKSSDIFGGLAANGSYLVASLSHDSCLIIANTTTLSTLETVGTCKKPVFAERVRERLISAGSVILSLAFSFDRTKLFVVMLHHSVTQIVCIQDINGSPPSVRYVATGLTEEVYEAKSLMIEPHSSNWAALSITKDHIVAVTTLDSLPQNSGTLQLGKQDEPVFSNGTFPFIRFAAPGPSLVSLWTQSMYVSDTEAEGGVLQLRHLSQPRLPFRTTTVWSQLSLGNADPIVAWTLLPKRKIVAIVTSVTTGESILHFRVGFVQTLRHMAEFSRKITAVVANPTESLLLLAYDGAITTFSIDTMQISVATFDVGNTPPADVVSMHVLQPPFILLVERKQHCLRKLRYDENLVLQAFAGKCELMGYLDGPFESSLATLPAAAAVQERTGVVYFSQIASIRARKGNLISTVFSSSSLGPLVLMAWATEREETLVLAERNRIGMLEDIGGKSVVEAVGRSNSNKVRENSLGPALYDQETGLFFQGIPPSGFSGGFIGGICCLRDDVKRPRSPSWPFPVNFFHTFQKNNYPQDGLLETETLYKIYVSQPSIFQEFPGTPLKATVFLRSPFNIFVKFPQPPPPTYRIHTDEYLANFALFVNPFDSSTRFNFYKGTQLTRFDSFFGNGETTSVSQGDQGHYVWDHIYPMIFVAAPLEHVVWQRDYNEIFKGGVAKIFAGIPEESGHDSEHLDTPVYLARTKSYLYILEDSGRIRRTTSDSSKHIVTVQAPTFVETKHFAVFPYDEEILFVPNNVFQVSVVNCTAQSSPSEQYWAVYPSTWHVANTTFGTEDYHSYNNASTTTVPYLTEIAFAVTTDSADEYKVIALSPEENKTLLEYCCLNKTMTSKPLTYSGLPYENNSAVITSIAREQVNINELYAAERVDLKPGKSYGDAVFLIAYYRKQLPAIPPLEVVFRPVVLEGEFDAFPKWRVAWSQVASVFPAFAPPFPSGMCTVLVSSYFEPTELGLVVALPKNACLLAFVFTTFEEVKPPIQVELLGNCSSATGKPGEILEPHSVVEWSGGPIYSDLRLRCLRMHLVGTTESSLVAGRCSSSASPSLTVIDGTRGNARFVEPTTITRHENTLFVMDITDKFRGETVVRKVVLSSPSAYGVVTTIFDGSTLPFMARHTMKALVPRSSDSLLLVYDSGVLSASWNFTDVTTLSGSDESTLQIPGWAKRNQLSAVKFAYLVPSSDPSLMGENWLLLVSSMHDTGMAVCCFSRHAPTSTETFSAFPIPTGSSTESARIIAMTPSLRRSSFFVLSASTVNRATSSIMLLEMVRISNIRSNYERVLNVWNTSRSDIPEPSNFELIESLSADILFVAFLNTKYVMQVNLTSFLEVPQAANLWRAVGGIAIYYSTGDLILSVPSDNCLRGYSENTGSLSETFVFSGQCGTFEAEVDGTLDVARFLEPTRLASVRTTKVMYVVTKVRGPFRRIFNGVVSTVATAPSASINSFAIGSFLSATAVGVQLFLTQNISTSDENFFPLQRVLPYDPERFSSDPSSAVIGTFSAVSGLGLAPGWMTAGPVFFSTFILPNSGSPAASPFTAPVVIADIEIQRRDNSDAGGNESTENVDDIMFVPSVTDKFLGLLYVTSRGFLWQNQTFLHSDSDTEVSPQLIPIIVQPQNNDFIAISFGRQRGTSMSVCTITVKPARIECQPTIPFVFPEPRPIRPNNMVMFVDRLLVFVVEKQPCLYQMFPTTLLVGLFAGNCHYTSDNDGKLLDARFRNPRALAAQANTLYLFHQMRFLFYDEKAVFSLRRIANGYVSTVTCEGIRDPIAAFGIEGTYPTQLLVVNRPDANHTTIVIMSTTNGTQIEFQGNSPGVHNQATIGIASVFNESSPEHFPKEIMALDSRGTHTISLQLRDRSLWNPSVARFAAGSPFPVPPAPSFVRVKQLWEISIENIPCAFACWQSSCVLTGLTGFVYFNYLNSELKVERTISDRFETVLDVAIDPTTNSTFYTNARTSDVSYLSWSSDVRRVVGGSIWEVGYRNGRSSLFHGPRGIVFNASRNSSPTGSTLLIADTFNHCVRGLENPSDFTSSAIVVAGRCELQGDQDGDNKDATFSYPHKLARTDNGLLYVMEGQLQTYRVVDLVREITSTISVQPSRHKVSGGSFYNSFTWLHGKTFAASTLFFGSIYTFELDTEISMYEGMKCFGVGCDSPANLSHHLSQTFPYTSIVAVTAALASNSSTPDILVAGYHRNCTRPGIYRVQVNDVSKVTTTASPTLSKSQSVSFSDSPSPSYSLSFSSSAENLHERKRLSKSLSKSLSRQVCVLPSVTVEPTEMSVYRAMSSPQRLVILLQHPLISPDKSNHSVPSLLKKIAKIRSESPFITLTSVNVTTGASVEMALSADPMLDRYKDYLINITIANESLVCEPSTHLYGTVKLRQVPSPVPAEAKKTLSVLAVSSGMVSGTVAIQQSRAVLVMNLVQCDFSHMQPLSFSQSPLQLGFGSEKGYYYRGGVLGNLLVVLLACVIILMGALFHSLAWVRCKKSFQDSLDTLCFPGIAILPFLVMFQSIVFCSVATAIHGEDKFDIALGTAGCLLCCTVILLCLLRLIYHFGAAYFPLELEEQQQQQQTKSVFTRRMTRFFVGSGSWNDIEEGSKFKRRFGRLFVDFRGGCKAFICLDLFFAALGGICEGIQPSSQNGCGTVSILVAVICGLMLLGYLIARPFVSLFDNVHAISMALFTFLSSICAVTAQKTDISHFQQAAELSAAIVIVLGTGKGILDVVLFIKRINVKGMLDTVGSQTRKLLLLGQNLLDHRAAARRAEGTDDLYDEDFNDLELIVQAEARNEESAPEPTSVEESTDEADVGSAPRSEPIPNDDHTQSTSSESDPEAEDEVAGILDLMLDPGPARMRLSKKKGTGELLREDLQKRLNTQITLDADIETILAGPEEGKDEGPHQEQQQRSRQENVEAEHLLADDDLF